MNYFFDPTGCCDSPDVEVIQQVIIEEQNIIVNSVSNLVQCMEFGVGVGLLELAKEIPFVRPLAFMVGAVISNIFFCLYLQ